MPTHPYAHGATYSYAQSSADSAEQHSHIEVTNAYRQPVIHPYATYGGHLSPIIQEDGTSPSRKMFAQVTSGQIREILPDEIQYSPYIMSNPGFSGPSNRLIEGEGEKSVKRHSDTLHVGEALNWTFNRGSPDSGFGASEDHHPFGPTPAPAPVTVPQKPIQRRPVDPPKLDFPDDPSVLFPLPRRKARQGPSKLGPSQVAKDDSDPPSFKTSASSSSPSPVSNTMVSPGGRVLSGSSGSSHNKSHDSSPPISLGSLGRSDDFERFHDLFYKPKLESQPSSTNPARKEEDLSKGVDEPVEIDQGFTSLAPQLRDDLSELNDASGATENVMWGRRFGGLKGERPTNATADPNLVLQRSRSVSALSNLASRVRTDTISGSTKSSVLEDVCEGQSSSGMSFCSLVRCLSAHVGVVDDLRLGQVEVVTTPPPVRSVHRLSSSGVHFHSVPTARNSSPSTGHVTLVDAPDGSEIVKSSTNLGLRQTSTLSTGVTRSSCMTNDTNTSRISGLSDFPRPPSNAVPVHDSIIASYFDSTVQQQEEAEDASTVDSPLVPIPQSMEWRESLRATFGGEVDTDVARAL
jgi:serine/arginine repetitive matrix protein 2